MQATARGTQGGQTDERRDMGRLQCRSVADDVAAAVAQHPTDTYALALTIAAGAVRRGAGEAVTLLGDLSVDQRDDVADRLEHVADILLGLSRHGYLDLGANALDAVDVIPR